MARFIRGGKGMILTLDMVIATFLFIFLASTSLYYVSQTDSESLSSVNMLRLTYDLMDALDRDGTLQSFDYAEIREGILSKRPVSYDYRLLIYQQGYQSPVVVVETSTEMNEQQFIGTGKYFFVSQNQTAGMVSFWVWVKENE